LDDQKSWFHSFLPATVFYAYQSFLSAGVRRAHTPMQVGAIELLVLESKCSSPTSERRNAENYQISATETHFSLKSPTFKEPGQFVEGDIFNPWLSPQRFDCVALFVAYPKFIVV
jgi:hypothetical protein